MPEPGNDPAPAPPSWSMDLRGTTAPALVEIRRWASRTLARVDDTHLGDVLLVTTEPVTNAHDHGDGPLQVRMSHPRAPAGYGSKSTTAARTTRCSPRRHPSTSMAAACTS